jgi:hypothetical protein
MGHCNIEIEKTKTNNSSYGNKKQPYGNINTEIENKTSKNNKNDEKITKNNDYENIKNKVMKNQFLS